MVIRMASVVNPDLVANLMARVRARGGIVTLDGHELVVRSVLRQVLNEYTDAVAADMRARLAPQLGPGGEAAIDEAARRIEATIAEMLPALN
jgi:hypothetical protein